MKNNHPQPSPDMSPVDRALWLAKHDAPRNMRLVTDLELHAIAQGLREERTAKEAMMAECRRLMVALERAHTDTDSFLTLLQGLSNHMDEPTGLAIIYEEANRIGESLDALKTALGLPPRDKSTES